MSTRREREQLGAELELRSLVPGRAEQAEIRAEAEQVAAAVQQRRDARKAVVEAKLGTTRRPARLAERMTLPATSGPYG